MPHPPEHTIEQARATYLMAYVTLRLADITDLALNGNMDAVSLLVFALEQALGGAHADEQGVIDYWRALRKVEDVFHAAGQPE